MDATATLTLNDGKMAAYRELCDSSMKRFIAYSEAVPDEHFDWKATPTAKSVHEIAAHVAASNQLFIESMQGNPPATDFPEAMKWIDEHAAAYTDRAELAAALRSSHVELLAMMNAAPSDMVDHEHLGFFYSLGAIHAWGHCAQIELLQTCWGDHGFYRYSEN